MASFLHHIAGEDLLTAATVNRQSISHGYLSPRVPAA